MYKSVAALARLDSTSAFAPTPTFTRQSADVFIGRADWSNAAEIGWSMGGEGYTCNIEPKVDEDPRKTIHQGESFEEHMKNHAADGGF